VATGVLSIAPGEANNPGPQSVVRLAFPPAIGWTFAGRDGVLGWDSSTQELGSTGLRKHGTPEEAARVRFSRRQVCCGELAATASRWVATTCFVSLSVLQLVGKSTAMFSLGAWRLGGMDRLMR